MSGNRGIRDLDKLLLSLAPRLYDDDYVFCSVSPERHRLDEFESLATFREPESVSLVLLRKDAEHRNLAFDSVFRLITLTVHSSLDAVGLTAAVSGALAAAGISANVIAACHHDHILIPASQADRALDILKNLARGSN